MPAISPVDREELERRAWMWAQGLSTKQMAEECCVSVDAITSYASYHREHFPHRHVTTIVGDAEERERARVMRADGMTYRAIAKTLGRSRSTVRQWCKDRRLCDGI